MRYLQKLKRDEDRENFKRMLDGLDNSLNAGEMPSGAAGGNAAGVAGAAGLGAAAGGTAAAVAGGGAAAAGGGTAGVIGGTGGVLHFAVHAGAGAGAVALGPVFLAAAIASASGAALWGGILLLTPAKRVVIPATIYIAKLRQRVYGRIGGGVL